MTGAKPKPGPLEPGLGDRTIVADYIYGMVGGAMVT